RLGLGLGVGLVLGLLALGREGLLEGLHVGLLEGGLGRRSADGVLEDDLVVALLDDLAVELRPVLESESVTKRRTAGEREARGEGEKQALHVCLPANRTASTPVYSGE